MFEIPKICVDLCCMETNKIVNTDCIQGMRSMPDGVVNCCVTSPPYFGLRSYNVEGQYGLEPTPDEYVSKMVEVFREVKRVLRDDGTLWLNLGDSYAADRGYQVAHDIRGGKQAAEAGSVGGRGMKSADYGLKPKDLIGIPWRVAFALQADGWYLRQDIIWHKPNPMPESVTDRCTKAHEYIFLLSKSPRYYYDQDSICEPITDATILRLLQDTESQKGSERVPGKTNGTMKAVTRKKYDKSQGGGGTSFEGHSGYFKADGTLLTDGTRNKRSVWTVTTKPFKDAHFATFPEDLIVDCIKAGCPEDGLVLDPFMGAGTTALVSRKLNRNYIGFELNPEYIKIAEKRLRNQLGLFQ